MASSRGTGLVSFSGSGLGPTVCQAGSGPSVSRNGARSESGAKSLDWVTEWVRRLLRRDAHRLGGVDAVHQVVELAHDDLQLPDPRLAFPAELLVGGQRRPDVADRIAGRGGERLG